MANPIGLAAGLDKNGAYIDALGNLGFGFIEVGTVTPRAHGQQPRAPRMFRLPRVAQSSSSRLGFGGRGWMRSWPTCSAASGARRGGSSG